VLINDGLVLSPPFDPYPFVFFNLILAILVALQGPLIVMSQNRQVLKDRVQAETDFRVNLKNEVNIERLLREISQLNGQLHERLRQLESDRAGSYNRLKTDHPSQHSQSTPS